MVYEGYDDHSILGSILGPIWGNYPLWLRVWGVGYLYVHIYIYICIQYLYVNTHILMVARWRLPVAGAACNHRWTVL